MSWLSSIKSVFLPIDGVNKEDIQHILEHYSLPSGISLKDQITEIQLIEHRMQLTMHLHPKETRALQQIHDELIELLKIHQIHELNLHVIQQKKSQPEIPLTTNAAEKTSSPRKAVPQQAEIASHPRIQDIIVVASGKGGVGKSTTTVNLALALQKMGKKVGILDADIYGPSIPTMLGNAGQTPLIENEHFVPLNAHGLAILSIGHLVGANNTPVAWRGPKATGALMQLFNQTLWPDLDILLIDLPPGTGDIQLTLAQRIPITGAVIVTTPQNIALLDAVKGIELFNRVSIPILGVVENMSTHICSECGTEEHIFGQGGGDHLSAHYNIPLLGHLPLLANIRKQADLGRPSVLVEDEAYSHYLNIAQGTLNQLEKIPKRNRDLNRIF